MIEFPKESIFKPKGFAAPRDKKDTTMVHDDRALEFDLLGIFAVIAGAGRPALLSRGRIQANQKRLSDRGVVAVVRCRALPQNGVDASAEHRRAVERRHRPVRPGVARVRGRSAWSRPD